MRIAVYIAMKRSINNQQGDSMYAVKNDSVFDEATKLINDAKTIESSEDNYREFYITTADDDVYVATINDDVADQRKNEKENGSDIDYALEAGHVESIQSLR
jgi:hypothetical protein